MGAAALTEPAGENPTSPRQADTTRERETLFLVFRVGDERVVSRPVELGAQWVLVD